jgi:uncharacterized protein (DUF697 family)
MAGWKELANVWKNVREVDLRPIREEALREVRLALVGEEGSGRRTLAEQLRRDPNRPNTRVHTPVNILGLDPAAEIVDADLIIIVVRAASKDLQRHQVLARQWTSAGKKVVVFYNLGDDGQQAGTSEMDVVWDALRLFVGRADDSDYLLKTFVPAIIELMPDLLLSFGRHFPLFRVPVAHHLINDTAFSNAAYALSSGLAEIVPVLGIPLNITDMVVLTKAQAFLVYRLGLELGFSTRWQDYVSEFGSVVGGGFLWRQLARYLVGLIPVVGILPKVAVSYAGTYVVGQVVLRWYLTGRHVSPQQVRGLYRQAFEQGKNVARNLLAKTPRPRLIRRRRAELPPGGQNCPNCGKVSAADAAFCQYCGQAFTRPTEGAA